MTKYARNKTGRLVDVWRVPEDFPTLAALERSLPGGGFIVVPDDAQNGAQDNGDGTYTNPVIVRPVTYTELSLLAFLRLCQKAGGMTDDMLVACRKDPLFEAFWIKFTIAESVVYGDEDTEAGLDALATMGYLPKGADAVKAAWPRTAVIL